MPVLPEPPIGESPEFEPRARIINSITGEVTPIPKGAISGLDEFANAWKSKVDIPEEMRFEAWQMSDEDHPAGTGKPAYRLVHKMIRTIPFPRVSMTYPNARINFENGPVTLGEPRFDGALPARRAGTFMVPEWGEVTLSNGQLGYKYVQNMRVSVRGHQETTPPTNYIEFLYQLPQGQWVEFDEMLAAGRAGVSAITCMIDLVHGERILGPVLTEEIGEVFDDWHWNRLLGGRTISLESQAAMRHLDGQEFAEVVGNSIEAHLDRPERERNRLKIAAQWYWRADAEPERVQRYIAYWLCIEALELGENASIAPVKRAVAEILGVDQRLIGQAVGRMHGIRSGLVHGSIREVSSEAALNVERVAVALLERRALGRVSEERANALRLAMGLVEAERGESAPKARP